MEYLIVKLVHLIGAVMLGAGLIGVWLADLRARQLDDLPRFSEAIRNIGVFYNGLAFPGALLLLVSGTWMIVTTYGGWSLYFLRIPWLAGMVVLFAFEFIEGNSVTRVYFVRLQRLTLDALREGRFTSELERARDATTPTFTHFLDLPIFLVIVSLGTTKPNDWGLFLAGTAVSLAVAAALTIALPRLVPWHPSVQPLARVGRKS